MFCCMREFSGLGGTAKDSLCWPGATLCRVLLKAFAWTEMQTGPHASKLQRRSTSGGAVRRGNHTWGCYSVTQSTMALSSWESEMYATGSATARGLQSNTCLIETNSPCNLKIY
eukprot:1042777-Pyramimonas_sp.AAC.1